MRKQLKNEEVCEIEAKLWALRRAGADIASKREDYVCSALSRAYEVALWAEDKALENPNGRYHRTGELTAAAQTASERMWAIDRLHQYIGRQLGSASFLENWLEDNHGAPEGLRLLRAYKPKMRATRLRWIDWMIACLKEDLVEAERPRIYNP